MGCNQGKVDNAPNAGQVKDGGRKVSGGDEKKTQVNGGGGGGAEVSDPRSPLDSRQIFKVKQSWKAIKRSMEETGVEMFLRLFKQNGELKSLFTKFKHLETEDELRSDEALEHHATLVMTTLDEAIMHIDNVDYVSEVLKKTGGTHTRIAGFKKDTFWNIKDPFLDAVKITLGDRYTENMEAIYKLAIIFILQSLEDGFDEQSKNASANQVPATNSHFNAST